MRWLAIVGLLLAALFYSPSVSSQEEAAILLLLSDDSSGGFETQFCITDGNGSECSTYFETSSDVTIESRAIYGNKTPVFINTPGYRWEIDCGDEIVDRVKRCCSYDKLGQFRFVDICIQQYGISIFEKPQTLDVFIRQ